MGTVVQLKNQINDSYFQLRESVEEKLISLQQNLLVENKNYLFGF